MSVAGTYNVTMNTPVGAQSGELVLEEADGALTGTMGNQGTTIPLQDGTVDGDHVTFKAKVTSPMPITLEFSGDVAGDSISGSVAFGAFGNGTWSGSRV
jgi:hypothetical protein